LNYGDPIRILECNNEEDEARRVVSEILHCRFSDNVKNADIALLYRGNHQARVFEKALREHQVPYHVHGGQSFFERSEIKDIMSYLKLIANPDDDTALLRVINTPRREIGPSTLEKIGHFSTEHKVSLLGACKHPHINSVLNKRASLQIQGFADLINELQIKSRQQTAFKLTRELIQSIEYEGWLKETCNTLKAAETKISYVNDLVKWLENIAEKTDHESLAETTAYLTLMDIIERQSEAENDDQVTLMTLHSSKGLEFPTVFLVGMEEQLLPHRASIEEETIDEERRLAYVGITRAQKQLIVTLAKRRKRQGEIVECEPSRFLNELPQEDFQWEKKQKADVKKSKEKGNAYLANLKEMLK
jgi:ATP-dependent DNA helicase Rep